MMTTMQHLTQSSRQRFSTTALYYACFVLLGLSAASLGPTLPYLASNTQSTLQAVSILLAFRAFGYFLGALFGARLYDFLPGHPLIAVVFLAFAFCLAFVPLISTLWVLAGCLLVVGIFQSLIDSGTNTLMVWLHRDKVAPFMNGLHFAFGVGAFLMPIVVAQSTLWSGSPAWAFWLLSLLALPLAVLFSRSVSPLRLEQTTPPQDLPRANTTLAVLIALFLFFYAGIEVSFGNWIYTYALQRGLADEVSANYLTSAFWGAYTLGRLLTIPLAARLQPSRLLWLCLFAAGFSVLPMLLAPASQVGLWSGSLLLGLSIAAIFPAVLSFAERHMTIKGQIMGIFFTGMSLGAASIPWLIGQGFERIGPQMMLIAVSSSLLMSMVMLSIIMWKIKTKENSDGPNDPVSS
jgi:MFS transporter, FHS family, Na+ dependent glucose transporter 1